MKPSCEQSLLYEWVDERMVKDQQKAHLDYFRHSSGRVLEIGCGRGTMLRLMKESGIEAYGLDSFKEAVEYCSDIGLEVIHDNALNHLRSLPSETLGGIFCAHVIEHMNPGQAILFLKESCRVLKKDSSLIIITPNPKDLRTTERFWLDITHVRPYPAKLLVALLKREGFEMIEVKENKEPSKNILERLAKFLLKAWFMGFLYRGDLVVIATR